MSDTIVVFSGVVKLQIVGNYTSTIKTWVSLILEYNRKRKYVGIIKNCCMKYVVYIAVGLQYIDARRYES